MSEIRAFQKEELGEVMRIWLQGNLYAHPFVPAGYWRGNYERVAGMLSEATWWVAEKDGRMAGFVGVSENYIAGLFVDGKCRSQGIGTRLLKHVQTVYDTLSLYVYEQNRRAVGFYQRRGF